MKIVELRQLMKYLNLFVSPFQLCFRMYIGPNFCLIYIFQFVFVIIILLGYYGFLSMLALISLSSKVFIVSILAYLCGQLCLFSCLTWIQLNEKKMEVAEIYAVKNNLK